MPSTKPGAMVNWLRQANSRQYQRQHPCGLGTRGREAFGEGVRLLAFGRAEERLVASQQSFDHRDTHGM